MKKYLQMSSAAVMIGALRVKIVFNFDHSFLISELSFILFNSEIKTDNLNVSDDEIITLDFTV